MKDESKTKLQLIKELKLLRGEVARNEKLAVGGNILKDKEDISHYLTVLNESSDPIFSFYPDGEYRYVNKAFAVGTGKKIEEIIGKKIWDVFPREEADKRYTALKQVFEQGEVKEIEVRVPRPDGDFYYITTIKPIKNEKQEVITVVCISKDITARRRAEEEFRRYAEEIRDLYDNAPCGYHSLADDGSFLRINDTELQWLGYTREEIIGKKKFSDLLTPDNLKIFQNNFPLLKTRGWVSDLELEMVCKGGTIMPIVLNATAVRDAAGKFVMSRTTIIDNTERKKVQNALKESEEKFTKAFNVSPIFMAISTIESGAFIEVNESFLNILGYRRHEVIGKTSKEINLFCDFGQRKRIIKNLSENGYVRNMDVTVNTQDGNIIYGIFSAEFIELQGNRYLLTVMSNITERKKAEDDLRESEERFRRIFEDGPVGMIISDSNGTFLRTNSFFCNMLGYTDQEMRKLTYKDITYSEDLVKDVEHVQKIFTDEINIYRTEKRYIRKNGEIIWGALTVSAVRNVRNEFLYYLGMIEDITSRRKSEDERSRLEELLRRSEKMEAIGKLAGGVAHDLNNILGVLVGYSELMLLEIPEGHSLRRHVTNILQSGERAAAIIQDLLTLARRGVAASEVVNLNTIINNYFKTPEFAALSNYHPQITFEADLDKQLLCIKGSAVHLSKTIMNLMVNAAEAITESGSVIVRTENLYLDKPIRGYEDMKEGDYVLLAITDNGMGISPKDIERIFEPFYTKKIMGRSGTGLGLAVVWGTVKDHNGYIDVRSEEGKGSSFHLYFPVTREMPADIQKSPSASVYRGKGEIILVVDDVKEQRELATLMLSSLGYNVHAVSSGEEAVDYLKTNKVDLLILDMIMDPGIDGLETFGRILEINPQQKAVIVSGFSETDRVKKAQELGAGEYVLKPYILEQIGLAVRRELEKSKKP